jgi:hypothetical protein
LEPWARGVLALLLVGLLRGPHPLIKDRSRPRDVLALPQLYRVAGALFGGQGCVDHDQVSPDRCPDVGGLHELGGVLVVGGAQAAGRLGGRPLP